MQKIFFLSVLTLSFSAAGQLPTIPDNSDGGNTVEPSALKCRDARFRMVSDCANIVYYDEDQDAVFHKKAGSPYSGSCKTCHINGNVEMYLTFVNGKPVGQDTIYYENGQINLIRSHDSQGLGKEDGKWLFYREDGSLKWEKNFIMGAADGEQRYYFPDSSLQRVEMWRANQLNGKKQEYWENGTLKKEIDYKNGEWDGMYKTFFENGMGESQQQYVNGKKEGPSTYWYENGQIFYTETHERGSKEGVFERFYMNGNKWTVESYKGDKRHGNFEEYYDNDKNVLKYKAYYKKGILKEEHYYDEFGDEIVPPEKQENSGEGGE